ncbi:MAG: response regulator [Hyphomicrobium sp.]
MDGVVSATERSNWAASIATNQMHPDPMNSPSACHVLYVDDEPAALKYFRLGVCRAMNVTTCGTAEEALAILATAGSDIDVVFTDDRMPCVSGAELLSEVAHRWPDKTRILTTAFIDNDRLEGFVARRLVDHVIIKPWNLEDLETAIQTVHCERRSPSRSGKTAGVDQPQVLFQPTPRPYEPVTAILFERDFPGNEFRKSEKIEIPPTHLTLCTFDDCLKGVLPFVHGGGLHGVELSLGRDMPVPMLADSSCVAGALAEIVELAIIAARVSPQPQVSIDVRNAPEHVIVSISGTGSWQDERVLEHFHHLSAFEPDLRSGVGLAHALRALRICGAAVTVTRMPSGCLIMRLVFDRLLH